MRRHPPWIFNQPTIPFEADLLLSRVRTSELSPLLAALSGLESPQPTDSLTAAVRIDERFTRLQSSCALLADGFDELDEFINEYVRDVPLSAYDTDSADAERFLDWLADRTDLTDEQQDYVTSQRSRYAVEFVAVKQRLAHVRFQRLLSASASRHDELLSNRRLMLHLNPIHVWATFETRVLLDNEVSIPAPVLFYAVGREVRSAVIEPYAGVLLRDLERSGPVRVAELRRLTTATIRMNCANSYVHSRNSGSWPSHDRWLPAAGLTHAPVM